MAHKVNFELAAPEQVEAALGQRLEQIRLSRNISQAQLAREAGVSRRTMTRMAQGQGISLDTFIRVLGALGLLQHLAEMLPDPMIQPIERIRHQGKRRQRARSTKDSTAEPWTWQD